MNIKKKIWFAHSYSHDNYFLFNSLIIYKTKRSCWAHKFSGKIPPAMISYQCWKSLDAVILFLINYYTTPSVVAYNEGKTFVGESALNAAVKLENIIYCRKKLQKADYWFFKTQNEWLAGSSSKSRYGTIWSCGLSKSLIETWIQ